MILYYFIICTWTRIPNFFPFLHLFVPNHHDPPKAFNATRCVESSRLNCASIRAIMPRIYNIQLHYIDILDDRRSVDID